MSLLLILQFVGRQAMLQDVKDSAAVIEKRILAFGSGAKDFCLCRKHLFQVTVSPGFAFRNTYCVPLVAHRLEIREC